MLPETPRVSVILPIRNESAYIRSCIERLLEQDYAKEFVEILVIDGESTDGTQDIVNELIVEHPQTLIRLLSNAKQIVPPALNIGIREARGDILIRMDGHSIPENDYISSCVRALKDTGAANAGGLLRPGGSTHFGDAVAYAQSHPVGAGDAKFHYAQQAQFVDTVYLGAFRKEVFTVVGLFDESLVRNQDYEMNVRIRKAGGKVYLDPDIQCWYTPRGSARKLWKQYFQYGWWRVETVKRHPESLRWRQVVPPGFVAVLVSLLVLALVSKIFVVLLVGQLVSYGLILGLAAVHIRSDLRRNAKLFFLFPLALVIMHISWGLGFLLNLCTLGNYPYRAEKPNIPSLGTKPEGQVSHAV